jgi:DNA-binding NtrC family response regulator
VILMPRVIVVDDDEDFLFLLNENARLSGQDKLFDLRTFTDPLLALESFKQKGADVVVTDVRMEGMDGMKLFRSILEMDASVPVIIISAYASVEKAVDAVRMGAHHYFEKPIIKPEIFWEMVHEAVLKRRLLLERKESFNRNESLDDLVIGQSRERKRLLQQIEKVCTTDTTVLITGETGVGKKLTAEAIYKYGNRSGKPFVTMHCLEFTPLSFEETLFGIQKGAFPGARSDREGLVELADGGTLFLNEISATPMNAQTKLLRLLQDHRFTRVGEAVPRSSHFRLIAATARDLKALVDNGAFHSGLYYYLNVFPISIAPLRDRKDDILPLALYFLAKHQRMMSKEVDGISYGAMTALFKHSWPGNVAELEKVIESAIVSCDGVEVRVRDLNFLESEGVVEEAFVPTLRESERLAIMAALQKTDGRKKQAARLLGIHRNTLANKMRELSITDDSWRLTPREDRV